MSTSPEGSVNTHDWKRTGEVVVQFFLSYFAADLIRDGITALSQVHTTGVWQVLIAAVVLGLTEIGKRFAQKPTE